MMKQGEELFTDEQVRVMDRERAGIGKHEADLCYRMQRWPRYLYGKELNNNPALRDVANNKRTGKQRAQWGGFVRELFGRAYGVGVERMEEPRAGAEWAAELHKNADAIPEWSLLEGTLAGDAWRAGVAAAHMAGTLEKGMPELPGEDLDALQREQEVFDEVMAGKNVVSAKLMEQRGELQQRIAKAKRQADDVLQWATADGGHKARKLLRTAAFAANATLEKIDEALVAVGLGPGTNVAPIVRQRVASQMIINKQLMRIAEIAGRLKAQAVHKQRTKVNRVPEEVHGVTKGDDLQHLLASEVGLLAGANTRPLLLSRIAERRALQYEMRGKETKTRGPIVFCIDTSSSMRGKRDEWAKACALAMMEIARRQKRGFAIMFFNTSVVKETFFQDPAKLDFSALFDALGYFSGGGTNISEALRCAHGIVAGTARKDFKGGKDADVVVISDGDDDSPVEHWTKQLHEIGASVYAVFIGSTGKLKDHVDDFVRMGDHELQHANDKLNTIFSL